MKNYDWSHLDDEEIEGEIKFCYKGIEDLLKDPNWSSKTKERLTNDYLDKLKTLYDEQRKRRNA